MKKTNGDISKLTPEQQTKLKELLDLKKQGKLSPEQTKELKDINKVMGFKPPKKGGKGKDDPKGGSNEFKPGNDFSWWNKFPKLTEDVANNKCDYVAGLSIAPGEIPFVVPGVLRAELISMYGANVDPTEAINEWAREIYLRMFQKFRTPQGYTYSDLGICIIACLEVVKLTAKYERLYGVINRYDKKNVNIPFTEARALGLTTYQVNYLQGHLSDFRSDLNNLIRREQRICIPKDISLIADSLSLLGYEYLDHNSGRSQIIVFDTTLHGYFNDTDLTSGGCIHFMDETSIPLFDFTADNMCRALEDAINRIIGSDSLVRIMADLVTWFGEEAMLQFNLIDESLISVPVYSESILHKLHNCETFEGSGVNIEVRSWADPMLTSGDAGTVASGYYIYQVDDRIVTLCGVVDNGTGTPLSYRGGTMIACPDTNGYLNAIDVCHMIDTYTAEVKPETIVEGAMWKFTSEYLSDANGNGVRVITSSAFWMIKSLELYDPMGLVDYTMSNVVHINTSTARATAGRLCLIDWAPLSYNLGGNAGNLRITDIYGDVDNVVPIHNGQMYKIHRVVQLSGLHTDAKVINK